MKSVNKFIRHYNKNQFWIFTALLDYALAVFLLQSNSFFDHPPIRWVILSYLDDPLSCAIIFAIATYTFTVALWDISWFRAGPIVAGLNTALWLLFGVAFLQHDQQIQNWGFYASICFITAVSILSYGATGGEHRNRQSDTREIKKKLDEIRKAGNKGGD
ncbi:MAG: hypothetical protein LKF36_12000 [Lactobacillus sp.]|jgi:hypothetical protein|nr:hypothetical protein [Lactobacillus sp.]